LESRSSGLNGVRVPAGFWCIGQDIFGSAVTFVLWAVALTRTTPTRVAMSVPINPVTASLVGALLIGESLGWNLIVGLATVFLGIWIATTNSKPVAARTQRS
jgi:drug/metabolite transporter (DMT)-like permease